MRKSFLLLACCIVFNTVFGQADLSLNVRADREAVPLGEIVTFTVTTTNNGPEMAEGVQVMDQLGSGLEFVQATANMGAYNEATGIWEIGRLANGVSAVLTIKLKMKNSGDYLYLAEISASDIRDPDSVPGNGVDTDRDGILNNDPDDEDDGGGQRVIPWGGTTPSGNPPTGGTSAGGANCLAPVDALSGMAPNPVDINGIFTFDYRIQAIVKFEMADTDGFSPEYFSGDPNELKMEYYVNSADGSILLPGGPLGFFKTNLSFSDRLGRIDGAIWLPNGQMVAYGYDAEEDRNVAVTRETAQTAEALNQNKFLQIQQFMSSAMVWGEYREPLPSRIQWRGDVVGYKSSLPDASTGLANIWIIYFDKDQTPIKTSVPMMGFLVGVVKDVQELQCNRLLVYTKIHIGGYDTGDMLEAELRSIKPMGITFDGSDYEPMILGGDYGTAAFEKMDDYEARMRSIEVRKQFAERDKKRCMNERCIERNNAILEDLRKEKSEVICEQMVAMGMENSFAECMREDGY